MRSLYFVAAAALAASAHAQTPEEAPRCSGQFECEVMWSEAQRTVEMMSDMRIRMATDSRIETFAPTRFGRVGVIVTREPVAPGVYEAQYRAICYRSTSCDPIEQSGRRFFNLRVNNRIKLSKPLTESPSEGAK